MNLEKLDFFEFFKNEYGELYSGFGIGGAGIITSKQMINVVNIDGSPKEGILPGWGGGPHRDTYREIIKYIYNIDYDPDKVYEKGDKRRGIEFRLIKIRYVNEKGNKLVVISIPAKINKFQYESLCILDKQIQVVNKLSKNKITVLVENTGWLPNYYVEMMKIKPEISYYDEHLNNLPEALEYYKNHISVIISNTFPEEYILDFDKNKNK